MLPSDVLRRDGWCQFSWTDGEGRHCLSGAIGASSLGRGAQMKLKTAAGVAVHASALGTAAIGYAILWNDKKNRTAEEVIALLEKVEYKLGLRVLDDSMIENPVPWAEHMEVRVAAK